MRSCWRHPTTRKITGETPEVRSDKRKEKKEKKEKNQKKKKKKDVLKTEIDRDIYLGRNAQNLKKWGAD